MENASGLFNRRQNNFWSPRAVFCICMMIHLIKSILCSKDEYLIYYFKLWCTLCSTGEIARMYAYALIKTNSISLRHTFPLRRKVLGWDSAGGTVTHNFTLFYRIDILLDLEMGYAFVKFFQCNFFLESRKERRTALPKHRRFSTLISLTEVSSCHRSWGVHWKHWETFKTLRVLGTRCIFK